MALELVSSNQFLIPGKNPKALRFRKSGLITTAGVRARLAIHVKTTFAITGEKLHLTWGQKEVEWEFGTYIGNDPNVLPIQGAMTLHDWANEIASIIQRHPKIWGVFTVSNALTLYAGLTDAFVVLESIETGAEFSLSFGANNTVSPGTETENTSGVDEVIIDNFYLDGRILSFHDIFNDYRKSEIPFNMSGYRNGDQFIFDFHEIPAAVGNQLGFDLPINPYLPFCPTKSIAIAYFQVRENGDVRPVRLSPGLDFNFDPQLFFVLNSAMPLARFNPAASLEEDCTATDRIFLSNFPLIRLVGIDQPNWLTFFCGDTSELTVTIDVYYTDGSDDTRTDVHELPLLQFATIPVGIDQLNLQALNPTKTILKYTISIVTDLSGATEVRTFVVDSRFQRNSRYLLFQNSYGFPEVLRCIGNHETGLQSSRERVLSVITEDSRIDTGTVSMNYNSLTKVYSFATGWLMSKSEADQFSEILLSGKLYEIPLPLVPRNSDFAPFRQRYSALELITDKIELYDDRTFGYGIKWQMKQAWDDYGYSPIDSVNEKIYADVIEFTIKHLEFTGSSPLIRLTGVKNEWRVTINGIESTSSSINFSAQWAGDYHVKVEGHLLEELSVVVSDFDADLEITGYKSLNLVWVLFQYFNKISNPFLLNMWDRPLALQSIFLYGNEFDIDGVLQRLVAYQNDSGSLLNVDLMGPTPSGFGYQLKDWLIANGVSVTTV